MKTSIRTIAIAAIAVVASFSTAMHAQSGLTYARFTVPFAFDCGKAHMPAGVYTIDVTNVSVLTLHTQGHTIFAMTLKSTDSNSSAVKTAIFTHDRAGYVLTELRADGTKIEVLGNRRRPPMERASRDNQNNQVAVALNPSRNQPGN